MSEIISSAQNNEISYSEIEISDIAELRKHAPVIAHVLGMELAYGRENEHKQNIRAALTWIEKWTK